MADIAREKYLRLMTEIDGLEKRIQGLETEIHNLKSQTDLQSINVLKQEQDDLQNILAQKRNELARLSDGCRKPHSVA